MSLDDVIRRFLDTQMGIMRTSHQQTRQPKSGAHATTKSNAHTV